MRLLDDAFLQQLAATAPGSLVQEGLVRAVRVTRDDPYLDIAAIADVHVDRADPAPGQWGEVLGDFLHRYRRLHRSLAGSAPSHLAVVAGDLLCKPQPERAEATSRYRDLALPALQGIESGVTELLVIPGNTDAYAAAAGSSPYDAEIATKLGAPRSTSDRGGRAVASVIRVDLEEDGDEAPPLAYVAVIGFDSNDAAYRGLGDRDLGRIGADQLDAARGLVTTLRRTVGRTAPLYVVALTHHGLLPRGGPASDMVLDGGWQEDASRVLSGGEGDPACDGLLTRCAPNEIIASSLTGMTSNGAAVLAQLQRLRTSLLLHAGMQHRAITTILRTPVEVGGRASDVALVPLASFDPGSPAAGMVRMRLNLWRGEAEVGYKFDRGPYGEEASPLQTITPLQSASRISPAERRLLSQVQSTLTLATQAKAQGAAELADQIATTWDEAGYVALCRPDGSLPGLTSPRFLSYFLLLLVREGPNGGYELLLSRHTPLRPSAVGYWDTLLLPAFKSVQELLQRLRDDVLRQVVGKAADMDKAKSAQRFEQAVAKLIEDAESQEKDLWADKLREVATTEFVKVSPTTGVVTTYEYRLVVLLTFVADPEASSETAELSAEERTVVSWLDELPRIARPGEPQTGAASIPIEAIMADGAGLRWEPAADPDDLDIQHDPNRARELPPGAVWFPLPDADETAGPWTDSPSIVARNADVMSWVDGELLRRRTADGSLPPHLVMGHFQEHAGYTRRGAALPFAATGPDTPEPPAASTEQALRRVTFLKGYDLDEQRAYPESLAIKRVILKRSGGDTPSYRDLIQVFDADTFPAAPGPLSELELGEPLGVLRPVQRYVLRAGIQRAKEVNKFLAEELASDPWGFVQASWGGLTDPVTLTPPILEQIWPEDSDSGDGGEREFILCDGNHRVVQRVWAAGERMAAVAVVGEPEQPFYAHAFSRYEWGLTAKNELAVTPPPEFKHAAREVVSPAFEALLALGRPEKTLYRRFYRDLETGFGPMGGQGGRYV